VNLSYVMQKSRNYNSLEFTFAYTQRSADNARHVRDAAGMAGGVWVTRLDSSNHQLKQFLIRFF